VSTVDELRAARTRLVVAADSERRRFERALHDGVQQELIAVSVRLQLAQQLVATDLSAAMEALDEIGCDVRDALDRVRVLANEIYPSVLEARGLPDALHGAASTAGVAATVEAAGVGRYPAEVEAAVFFSCRAVLEDCGGRGGAEVRVTIRIREKDDALHLEIDGDTVNPAADCLDSARDRIEALGGVFSVGPAPGGQTRVAATAPL
jgi:signal transduction histidine kinase